jgi:hypothetical protein
MHVRFYDRGVDPKSAPVRDPGTLGDLDDLAVKLLDDVRPERARDLQDRFRVRHFSRIDTGEGAIDQIRADLALEIVIAPIEEMLQDQHPQHDVGWCPRASTPPTLRPARLQRLRHRLNHGLVLEQRVDTPQPVGPQFVSVGQRRFEQTPLALSASDHAHSFEA